MKKLLALVLALVMSMSLVTISNAAYSDKADIDLKEAVDVLSAVGVFEGSDGKFDPKANLTREQAAKLVAYLQLSQKSADALVGGNKFTDVAANRWSAGYVDYCATTGVVAGVGNGQFNPTGSLTALQFGKMLLVCLGYDATTENLTGADWQINTSKLMASAKLLKGLDSVKANDVITREQAAQMMLNAIKAPTVEYDTKGSTITIGGTVIGIGGSKATYVTATVAEDKSANNIGKTQLTNTGAYTVELGEKLFSNLKLSSDTDAFERPVTVWTLKAEKIGSYTGIANVPTIKVDDTAAATVNAYVKSGSAATVVYIDATGANANVVSSTKNVVFVKGSSTTGASYDTKKGTFYTYDAIVNGEITTIDSAAKIDSYKMYTVMATDANGVVSLSGDATTNGVFSGTGTDKAANDAIGLNGAYYSYSKDCQVFYIDSEGTISTSSIGGISKDETDGVWFKVTDGDVTTIVIKEAVSAAKTVISAAVKGNNIAVNPAATVDNTAKTIKFTVTGTAGNGDSVEITPTVSAGASASAVTLTYNGTAWSTATVTVTAENGTAADYVVSVA